MNIGDVGQTGIALIRAIKTFFGDDIFEKLADERGGAAGA